MISTRVLFIAALLSMSSLLGAAFFVLRGIRKKHENTEADLERRTWKAHREAERTIVTSTTQANTQPNAQTNAQADAQANTQTKVQIAAKATSATMDAKIAERSGIPSLPGAPPQTPAYTAMLQGILLGAAIVLLARALQWQQENS